MTVNSILVRWPGGFRHVVHPSADPSRIKEGFLSLDALSLAEVDRLALAVLDRLLSPAEQVKAKVEPAGTSDQPYFGYHVGDYLTAPNSAGGTTSQRVRSISVEEDDDGDVSFVPILRDRVLELDDRLQRALKRMANGSMQGRTDVASPSGTRAEGQAPAARGLQELPPFYWDGQLAVGVSGKYPVPSALTVTSIVVVLTTAGSSTTTVAFRVNGVVAETMNLGAGETELETPVNIGLGSGDRVTVAVTAAGTGAEDLTLCARLG